MLKFPKMLAGCQVKVDAQLSGEGLGQPLLQLFKIIMVIMTLPKQLPLKSFSWIPRKTFQHITFSFEVLHDHLAQIKKLSATETPRNGRCSVWP